MVKHLVTIMTLCFATPLLAQSLSASSPTSALPATQQSQAASFPAQSIGMFAYPKNQQTADQQRKDENDCFASAKQQSGIDPQAPPPATKTEEQKKAEQQAAADNAKQVKGGRARGAARGAAGGAAIGGRLLMMKRAKEPRLEPLRGLWRVEQSKGKPTKRPSSRQHRPLRNNNSSRKRKLKPPTNRVSTPLSEPSLLAWTLADTPSSDSLGSNPE